MLNLQGQSASVWRTLLSKVADSLSYKGSVVGILAFSAIATGLLTTVRANGAETKLKEQTVPSVVSQFDRSALESNLSGLADGVHLYGQAEEPNQIGSAYLVFESRGDKMIGAFYMPYSSFDCVYGQIGSDQLAMTVVDSYSQEAYPYAVALEQASTIADAEGSAEREINLEGFHAINEVGDVEQQILSTCVSNYQDQVW